jgi:hypothetical protein
MVDTKFFHLFVEARVQAEPVVALSVNAKFVPLGVCLGAAVAAVPTRIIVLRRKNKKRNKKE